MSKVKFKKNPAGVRELLNSGAMEKIVAQHAARIAKTAGAGYESTTFQAGTRVVGKAYADTWAAKRDNAKNNTLLKALNS